MLMMLSATSISRRVKPPSPARTSRATAHLPCRRHAHDLARGAPRQHDSLRGRAGADTIEKDPRHASATFCVETKRVGPAALLEGTAGERLPRAIHPPRKTIA